MVSLVFVSSLFLFSLSLSAKFGKEKLISFDFVSSLLEERSEFVSKEGRVGFCFSFVSILFAFLSGLCRNVCRFWFAFNRAFLDGHGGRCGLVGWRFVG